MQKNTKDAVRQSGNIMRKIGQIRQTLNPGNLQHISSNQRCLHQYGSTSIREDHKWDNYRVSLEQRLDRLFRQEKEIIRERYYKNTSQITQRDQVSKKDRSASTEQMERKIRILEEKYRQAAAEQRQAQQVKKHEEPNPVIVKEKYESKARSTEKPSRVESNLKEQKNIVTKTVNNHLQAQVEALKQQVTTIKRGNELILEKLGHQRKRGTGKTKQLLRAILHKLQEMNGQQPKK